MDAKALLIKQGWLGPGNPLNPGRRPGAHGGLGLTKPILVARKQNTFGVGKKTVDHSNQWWLRGFEAALKGVGTPGTATPTSQDSYCPGLSAGSELHRFFVSGGILVGTIDAQSQKNSADTITAEKFCASRKSSSSKRKRGDDEDKRSQERAKRKEERRKKQKRAEVDEAGDGDDKHSSRTRQKAEKELKKKKKKLERRKAKEDKGKKKQAKIIKKRLKTEKKLAAATREEYATEAAEVERGDAPAPVPVELITSGQSLDSSDRNKRDEKEKSKKKGEKKRKQKISSSSDPQKVDADMSKTFKERWGNKEEKKKKRERAIILDRPNHQSPSGLKI